MSISEKIRAQIISSFRAELSEHIQTLTDGLLDLEQNRIPAAEREERMATIFRAAHSLKGAARAVGVTAIEQLAHALEDVLGNLQKNLLAVSPELFTTCYRAIDAIQAVETAYEGGAITPPVESLMALAALEPFRHPEKAAGAKPVPSTRQDQAGAGKKDSRRGTPRAGTSKNRLDSLRSVLADSKEDVSGVSTPLDSPPASPGDLSRGQPDAPPDAFSPLPGALAPTDETIRVSVGKLDSLMEQLNELMVAKIRAEQHMSEMRHTQDYVENWQKEWRKARGSYGRLSRHRRQEETASPVHTHQRKEFERLLAYVQTSQEYLKELGNMLNSLARAYRSDTTQMALVIDQLDEEVRRVRMLPFKSISGFFGRMVRDLALESGKDATLEIRGDDVELDKRVLEQIKDPIIHLLRNAVDHGIEPPARRMAVRKPAQGKIVLSVEQTGKDVSIRIQDDGAGLDLQAIREVAVRRQIKDAAAMEDAELSELIFTPSFSTNTSITGVSGRGIGLDVVRQNVETLNGSIQVESQPGQGVSFTLLLPASLTTSRALLVGVGGQMFGIPVGGIERILYLDPAEIQIVSGRETIRHEERSLNLVHLADTLGMPHTTPSLHMRLPVVILSSGGRQMAFIVEALLDEQEVVVKSLGRQIARVGGMAGASLLGSGQVLLVLNTADVIKLAWREEHPLLSEQPEPAGEATEMRPKHRILVVDDSITTRTLEKNILEAAGYVISLALDGQEAFNLLMTRELPDMVISDVQMPLMDGFALTEHIKKEPRTSGLPVILVTSLESPEDKARGIEAGADAYIVKQSFDQANLLETIRQLI